MPVTVRGTSPTAVTHGIMKRTAVALILAGISIAVGMFGLASQAFPVWVAIVLVAMGVIAAVFARPLIVALWHLRRGHDQGFTTATSAVGAPLVYLRSRPSLVHSERGARLPKIKVAYRSARGVNTYRLNVAENPGGDNALAHASLKAYQSDDAEVIVLVCDNRPDYIGRRRPIDMGELEASAQSTLRALTAGE